MVLYIRQLLTMVVSLYTSRVILAELGVEDFGIYNVVGGLVGLFSILSGSLSAAVSRFITFELGRGDSDRLRRLFSTSLVVQIIISLVVVLLLELVGVWFLYNKLDIPSHRIDVAAAVLHISMLSTFVNLVSVPYHAVIIAHERMGAFAYISMLEVVLKLGFVLALGLVESDKLLLYAWFMFAAAMVVRIIYGIYCKRNFAECRGGGVSVDRGMLKEIFNFAGWNFLGSSSYMLMSQGVNVLLNIFFGVMVNAGRGIATQVEGFVSQFSSNFTTAINPQITKSYAANDRENLYLLIYRGAKFSFLLMLLLAMPFLFETDYILELWLKTPPAYAATFLKITLVVSLVSVLSNPLITAMLATGDIKRYQIIVGGLGILVFPLAYICFRAGLPPESAYLVQLVIFVGQLIARLMLLRGMVGLSVSLFVRDVVCRGALVMVLSVVAPLCVVYSMESSLLRLIVVSVVSVVSVVVFGYIAALNSSERGVVNGYLLRLLRVK